MLDQWRQFDRYDLPQDIEINLIVAVNETIPRAHDLVPGDTRLEVARRQGYPVSRFADNLDELGQPEGKQAVAVEVGS
jgi:hypothetical protein